MGVCLLLKSLEILLMGRYNFVAKEPVSLCRCLCETLCKSGLILISGEISGLTTFRIGTL